MVKSVILDLDGTVYMGGTQVPGAGEFISHIRSRGVRVLFVTNRANRTPARIVEQLRSYGIECDTDDLLTSAQATVQFLKSGSVFCVGEEGMRQAIFSAGMRITGDSPDYVVVSFDRDVNYTRIEEACGHIERGAKFIATNPDMGLRTAEGVSPGTGAIVAAVVAGCGVEPTVIGKPERLIVDMALERLGVDGDEVIMIGDNVATDVPAGHKAGVRTALILTGISTASDAAESQVKPTWVVESYNELREVLKDVIG